MNTRTSTGTILRKPPRLAEGGEESFQEGKQHHKLKRPAEDEEQKKGATAVKEVVLARRPNQEANAALLRKLCASTVLEVKFNH